MTTLDVVMGSLLVAVFCAGLVMVNVKVINERIASLVYLGGAMMAFAVLLGALALINALSSI